MSRAGREAQGITASHASTEAYGDNASQSVDETREIIASRGLDGAHISTASHKLLGTHEAHASQAVIEAQYEDASHGEAEAHGSSAEGPPPVSLNSLYTLVKSYYAVQKARIQVSNRLENLKKLCKHRKGIKAVKGRPAKTYCTLKGEWVKIKDCPECEHFDPFVPKGEITYLHETVLKHLVAIERAAAYDIRRTIAEYEPEITRWALGIKGIGPIIVGALIGIIRDPGRFSNVSKLWRYFGLDPEGGKARRRKRGEKCGYNPEAKTLACYKIGDSFVKRGGFFREIYLKEKEYARKKHPDWTRGHVHNHARRVAAKLFLALFWAKWRELKGLPVPEPYPIAHLGHTDVITPDEVYWYDRGAVG